MLPGYFCDGCVQLEHISVPNTIVRLWDYVFDKCTTLQEVTLPDGVTDIGRHVFESCCCITEMIPPKGLRKIGNGAFQGCRMLEKVVLPDSPPELTTTGTFLGLPKDCKFYVPKGRLDVYQTAESWSSYASYMVEMEGDIP